MIAQAALSALAFASPPDASWIAGIYDDADDDDVIVFATAETKDAPPVVPAVSRPGPSLEGRLLDCDGITVLVRSLSALRSRAPPTA